MLVVYADGPVGGQTLQTDARLIQQERIVLSRPVQLLNHASVMEGKKLGEHEHFEYKIVLSPPVRRCL